MRAFLYNVGLQWRLDLRNKGVLFTYYVVPLIFFTFIGGVFTSINPTSKDTILQVMTVFGVSMGALVGSPTSVSEIYGSEIKKAYKVGGIPVWMAAINNFISSFIHLFILSLIIYFTSPIMFKAAIPENIPLYFLSLALFIVVCLSVGTVIGLFFKENSKLIMVSQLIFLPSLMLSGIMFPVNLLPSALQTVGKIFPATWGYIIMTDKELDFSNFIPLIIIFFVMLLATIFKLLKIKSE